MKRKVCDTHGLLHDHWRDEEGSTGAQVIRKASAPEEVAGYSADGGHNQVRELFLHQGQQPGRGISDSRTFNGGMTLMPNWLTS